MLANNSFFLILIGASKKMKLLSKEQESNDINHPNFNLERQVKDQNYESYNATGNIFFQLL